MSDLLEGWQQEEIKADILQTQHLKSVLMVTEHLKPEIVHHPAAMGWNCKTEHFNAHGRNMFHAMDNLYRMFNGLEPNQ